MNQLIPVQAQGIQSSGVDNMQIEAADLLFIQQQNLLRIQRRNALIRQIKEALDRWIRNANRRQRLYQRQRKRSIMMRNPIRVEPPTIYQRISAFINNLLWDVKQMPENMYSLTNVQKERNAIDKKPKKGLSIRSKIPDPTKRLKKP